MSLRPITKHSLAFSCDGDLAVAGDDAVQIFAPEFPKLPPPTHAGFIDEADLDDGGEWDDDALGRGTDSQPPQRQPATLHNLGLETRSQYSGASRTIPVSKKPLDPRVNSGLYAAAGEPFPAHTWTKTELQVTQDRDGHRDGLEELFYDVEDEDDEDVVVEDGVRNDNRSAFLGYTPLGSGIGPITGVGGSMNQFVSMAWSPNGLGTNRRPVLAVLTNTGVITVFGDGEEMAALARDAKSEYVQPRNLESWEVLWGVGERVTIPGQETEAEYIRSFAWAEDVGPRQAILGYLTDDKEMVLVSVQTSQDIEADENNGCKARGEDFRGRFVWQVREVARFTATGPHPDGHVSLDCG